jgi:hypothetical protein
LHSGDPAFAALTSYFRKRFGPALGSLLDAAAASGEIRVGVSAEDILYAVATLALPVTDHGPAYSQRMVGLLIDGLRYGAGESSWNADTLADMAAPVPLRRNRDFLYLWSGQAVSVLGSQMSRVAYPLLVLAITGSAAKAGFASAAATLPYLLFPLLAGAYADRHDRRRIMIACDILRLAALCGVAIAAATGRAAYPVVLVAGFAEGTGTAFYNIADRGAIPMLVHESQRATALAQNEVRSYDAQLTGPALGEALFGLSRFLPFAADAFSYMGSLFTLAMIRKPMQEARPEEPKQLARELAEGLRLTLRQPRSCARPPR